MKKGYYVIGRIQQHRGTMSFAEGPFETEDVAKINQDKIKNCQPHLISSEIYYHNRDY